MKKFKGLANISNSEWDKELVIFAVLMILSTILMVGSTLIFHWR